MQQSVNKRILLSGASGFLGSILSRALRLLQYDTVEMGMRNGQIIVDITKSFSLTQSPFDVVIHAAGKAHTVPRSEAEKKQFFQVNFEGTKNLCKALEGLASLPKAFIFISTVAVYGFDKGDNIAENSPLAGSTPYAKSKILAEEWLANWCRIHKVTLSILRLPLIAGPKPPGNLGAMINGIKSGKYLSIGKADAQKSMVWAEDIASIIPKLTEVGGIYNLTDGVHPSFGELEDAISSALGKKKPLKVPSWVAKCLAMVGDLAGAKSPINTNKLYKITSTLTFDDSKARQQLGWQPTPVLSKIPEVI